MFLAVIAILVVALLNCWATGPLLADFPLPPSRTGNLYLSSYGTHEVYCFSKEGKFRFRFDGHGLNKPRGLAFNSKNELYVASQGSHEILVFEPDGTYLRRFTADTLSGPTGVAIAPDGSIHVSSYNNHRVVVFNSDETYRQEYTVEDLKGPNCVAFTMEGSIYVASQNTDSFFGFTADLKPTGEFDGGGMNSTMGVALWDSRVFVTGGASHTVGLFTLSGGFEENITHSDINFPQGIAFDENGILYVSNYARGTVAVFDTDGNKIRVFGHPDIDLARSIALMPIREATFIRGDFNQDEEVDISDSVAILGYLFLGDVSTDCEKAGDVNDDGTLDVSDPIALLQFLFVGGSPPPLPFPDEGPDPTTAEDLLECL